MKIVAKSATFLAQLYVSSYGSQCYASGTLMAVPTCTRPLHFSLLTIAVPIVVAMFSAVPDSLQHFGLAVPIRRGYYCCHQCAHILAVPIVCDVGRARRHRAVPMYGDASWLGPCGTTVL